MILRSTFHAGIAILTLPVAIPSTAVTAFSMVRSSYNHRRPSILSSYSALSSSSLFVARTSGVSKDLFVGQSRKRQRLLQKYGRTARIDERPISFAAQTNKNRLFMSTTTSDENDGKTESNISLSSAVSELLHWLNTTSTGNNESEERNKLGKIKRLISNMEACYTSTQPGSNDNDLARFNPLLGLYDVSQTITAKPKQNPVGGKWTRSNGIAQQMLKTRRTFQHLLPFNSTGLSKAAMSKDNDDDIIPAASAVAEAVNVISLEAFWSLIRLTVILRGDAIPLTSTQRQENMEKYNIPLSNLAVKVNFDPPRIVFGRKGKIINLNVGPTSSVTLDTTYCDKKVRIGKGGTSGTKFVFVRCSSEEKDSDGEGGSQEPNEWRALLARKPMRKSRILSILSGCFATGLYGASLRTRGVIKAGGYVLAAFAGLIGLTVAFSSGGIEKDDVSYTSAAQGN